LFRFFFGKLRVLPSNIDPVTAFPER
jgi:hypothetical protein